MTNEARTEKWLSGKLALESGMGKISPWRIFRESICFCLLLIENQFPHSKIFTCYLPAEPLCSLIESLKSAEQINPSNNLSRTMKHCCIIQDTACMAAEWHNAAHSQTENNSLARHLQGKKAFFVIRACEYKSVRSHRCKTVGSSVPKPVTSKRHDLDWHTTWNYTPSAVLSW